MNYYYYSGKKALTLKPTIYDHPLYIVQNTWPKTYTLEGGMTVGKLLVFPNKEFALRFPKIRVYE